MRNQKITGQILLASISIMFSLFAFDAAQAGSYKLNYHSTPNASNCSWVYQWKWVYGKKVRVKVKVCN